MEEEVSESLSLEVVRELITLVNQYLKDGTHLSAIEFLEKEDAGGQQHSHAAHKMFLQMDRHRTLLVLLSRQCLPAKRAMQLGSTVTVLLYVLLLQLDGRTAVQVKDVLLGLPPGAVLPVLRLMCGQDAVCTLARTACSLFDLHHVQDLILEPLHSNAALLAELYECVRQSVSKKTRSAKPPTVPLNMRVLRRPRRPAHVAAVQQEVAPERFVSRQPPPVTYRRTAAGVVQRRRRLGAAARVRRPHTHPGAAAAPTVRASEAERGIHRPATRKPPLYLKRAPAPVRSNAATILREGAKYMKEQEEEIKRLEEMVAGGSNYLELEEMEAAQRRRREAEELEAVERRRLQGLLTKEEARLARLRLQQAIRARAQVFLAEKRNMEKKIEELRKKEEEKIKLILLKYEDVKHAAKVAVGEFLKRKQKEARKLEEERKSRLEESLKKAREEMERRLQLIREMKALRSLQKMRVKEKPDLTTTPGLGLLCEMSVAELSERLALMREEVKEELEERRKEFKAYKDRQQRLLKDMQDFVTARRDEISRRNKIKKEAVEEIKAPPRSKEIEELKRKLEQRRHEIQLLSNCPVETV